MTTSNISALQDTADCDVWGFCRGSSTVHKVSCDTTICHLLGDSKSWFCCGWFVYCPLICASVQTTAATLTHWGQVQKCSKASASWCLAYHLCALQQLKFMLFFELLQKLETKQQNIYKYVLPYRCGAGFQVRMLQHTGRASGVWYVQKVMCMCLIWYRNMGGDNMNDSQMGCNRNYTGMATGL